MPSLGETNQMEKEFLWISESHREYYEMEKYQLVHRSKILNL